VPNAPHFSAFASSLTPQQRQYIDLYVAEKVSEATASVIKSAQVITESYQKLEAIVTTLSAQVDSYESKFRDDSKYILTRGKLIAFMKKEGL